MQLLWGIKERLVRCVRGREGQQLAWCQFIKRGGREKERERERD